uniref:Uncharacterized protein n=1 Tax=Trichuris muris TaxID=70415 RepID=A0A5S6Q726_TRIMR
MLLPPFGCFAPTCSVYQLCNTSKRSRIVPIYFVGRVGWVLPIITKASLTILPCSRAYSTRSSGSHFVAAKIVKLCRAVRLMRDLAEALEPCIIPS